GIIFGNQLRRLSVQPVEWGQLKLVDPKSPFLRAAGVSKIATADWRAFSYCTPKAQQRFRLSETEAAYFILIEAPNLAHIDQLRWAAKDVLFRALAAAQMAPVAVVLAKTPGERDA